MDIYALSFLKTMDCPLVETQLHFLESDLIGRAAKTEKELERGRQKSPRRRGNSQLRFSRQARLAHLQLLRV